MSKSQGRTEEKSDAKKVIPDVELIRLLRIDLASGIYPTQQATAAALRRFDEVTAELVHQMAEVARLTSLIQAFEAAVEMPSVQS
jgi:hypothetical protein